MDHPPAGQEPARPRGAGRVAFLSRLAVIRDAVHEGHTIKAIYDVHRDALGITYSQFVRYVARYVKAAGTASPPLPAAPVPPARIESAPRTFTYTPSQFRKEDLI